MPTYILGISAFYHDSAACLIRDGHIVAAAQEERFTRKKFDAGFPKMQSATVYERPVFRLPISNTVPFTTSP